MNSNPNVKQALPSLRNSASVTITQSPRRRDTGSASLSIPSTGRLRTDGVGASRSGQGMATAAGRLGSRILTSEDPVVTTLIGADLVATKTAADSYYLQYREATAESARLRAALQQQEVDSMQVVHFLESKLKEVETEAQVYKNGVTRLLEEHQAAEESLQKRYGEVVRERDAELARYASMSSKLHDDLRQASRYVQQRQEHAVELQQLQKQLEDLVVSHEKEVAALHFQTVDRKLKLIALEKTMRAEFDALVEARAAAALEERFQGALERTRRLEEEKATMTHDIHNLMQLTTTIDAERVQVRRQAAVQQQAHKELAHHALARGRQKAQADLKIYELEEQVRALTVRQRDASSELQAGYESRIATLEADLKATRTSLQTHRTELQHMRQLTARVLGERSELENFFHTALADCQRYRAGKAATMGRSTLAESVVWSTSGGGAGGGGGGSATASLRDATMTATSSAAAETVPATMWPSPSASVVGVAPAPVAAHAGPAPAALPKDSGSGLFFEELPWEDKEKVIKSLLFFINANYYHNTALSQPQPPPGASGGGGGAGAAAAMFAMTALPDSYSSPLGDAH